MSQLTENIQEMIDSAHGRLGGVADLADEVEVVSAILSAHEMLVEARVAARRIKEGWQLNGVAAQLSLLEQGVFKAFHRALSGD